MEKSVYNSSIEDDQSYNTYETHNPTTAFAYNSPVEYHKSPSRFENQYAKPTGTFDLAFKNAGFKDTSTFASNSNYQSQAGSTHDEASINDETPIIQPYASNKIVSTQYPPSEYYNTDTLPLRDNSEANEPSYDSSYARDRPIGLMQELKSRLPKGDKPPTPPRKYSPTYSDQLAEMTYSPDFNTVGLAHPHSFPELKPKVRAKSEVILETNFDYTPEDEDVFPQPIGGSGRWKSQPLETAM